MSATGLDVFDKTVQTTNIWLKEMRAVSHALRDRLTIDEVAHLGAQMPLLVRGPYYDQWHPAGKPERTRHPEEFLAAVAAELDDIGPINAEDATRAVFAMLEDQIASGEIEDVKGMLPSQLRRLWPGAA